VIPASGPFPERHPEFFHADAEQRPRPIAFNHALHLQPNLPTQDQPDRRDPDRVATLGCSSCHEQNPDAASFAAPSYDRHCSACHALRVGMASCVALVPHAGFVAAKAYAEAQCAEPTQGGAALERELAGVCARCHHEPILLLAVGSIPSLAPTFGTARFSHRPHRMLVCEACHEDVDRSSAASDLLMPKKRICAHCHRADLPSARCVTCHAYHRSKIKLTEGRLALPK
jgi:hypothetical protein